MKKSVSNIWFFSIAGSPKSRHATIRYNQFSVTKLGQKRKAQECSLKWYSGVEKGGFNKWEPLKKELLWYLKKAEPSFI